MQFTRRDGLSNDSVRTLLEDSEGNLWVGTQDGGLNRLRLPLFAVYGPNQGLSSERVTTVSEGPDGELWVGTDGYGVNRLRAGQALAKPRRIALQQQGPRLRLADYPIHRSSGRWGDTTARRL